jgi:hypothetical protein
MTLTQEYNLQDAFADAIRATNNGSTRELIRYLQTYHRKVLDENALTIEGNGLGSMLRAFRKKPPRHELAEKIHCLCLDFGLPDLDLDDEVSVPMDLGNVLNAECDWPDIEDVTVDGLDRHLLLRDAQEKAYSAKTECYRIFRQRMAQIVPGCTDIPVRELRRIAREGK